tara:strand:- start:244 stop:2139 length:1896 start_codon:yes stop_codon:yes gene_type:complete
MIHKPKHLTWENLSEIYKRELINKSIYYTWKADGYLTKIKFNSSKMFLKIYNKERTILTKEIESIDLSKLNSIINYQNLNNIVIYGEFMSSKCYVFSRNKIFLFDLVVQNYQMSFIERYNILKVIVSKIIFIDNNCNLILEIKDCFRKQLPVIDFNSPYNRIKDSELEFEYKKECYAKCDGIIIYDQDNYKSYKVKYQNTFDLWLETITGKLYTEDLVFIGYIGPISSTIKEQKDIPYKLVEVCKFHNSIYYYLLKYRDDKKKADSYQVIGNIDTINPKLLLSYYVNQAFNHLPKVKINNNNLLTFEFRILKEEILSLVLKTIKQSKTGSINWLDIGCGNAHEINTFISLRSYISNVTFFQDSIYLLDNHISPRLYKRKHIILQQHQNIKQIKLINQNIYDKNTKNEIPFQSLDMITLFLSVTDLNDKLFRNLNYWIKPSGKIAIIFYDSTHLRNEGKFNIDYNFGLKPFSESKIKVYRNNKPKWTIEERLDIDKVIDKFKKYNYRKLLLINNESLDISDKFSEMMYGIIFKKYTNNHKLQDLLHIDIIQYLISKYLLPKDLINLKLLFPLVKWFNKVISEDQIKKNKSKSENLLPLNQDVLDNLNSLNNIHHSSDDSFESDSDYYGYLSF